MNTCSNRCLHCIWSTSIQLNLSLMLKMKLSKAYYLPKCYVLHYIEIHKQKEERSTEKKCVCVNGYTQYCMLGPFYIGAKPLQEIIIIGVLLRIFSDIASIITRCGLEGVTDTLQIIFGNLSMISSHNRFRVGSCLRM